MKVGSLFSGIGGFDLGLERAGMEIAWQVEIDPFCNKVLEKHWPNVKRYGDIKNVTNLESVDLICGGFPCQPYSCAGKRMGAEDDRALWPEMLRIIQEVRPRWIIGENVAGFINMGLDNSISDLEREGYTVQTFVIPACAVNAPHRRDRVWIIANSKRDRCDWQTVSIQPRESQQKSYLPSWADCHASKDVGNAGRCGLERESWWRTGEEFKNGFVEHEQSIADVADTSNKGLQGGEKAGNIGIDWKEPRNEQFGRYTCWEEPWLEVASRLCALDDGVSVGLARPGRNKNRVQKLKAAGNAVVPQIVTILGNAIMDIERKNGQL
jgi:DNA (cytosine-5)-methyltransferase 1